MQVSIVMPYYNAAKYIEETVNSILSQTYQDWELIIVDDCSCAAETEKTLAKVTAIDARIKVIRSQTNGGAGIARNIGIKEAKGKYLAFCDSDDWWYPTKLEEQIKFMEDNNYPFTCTWYEDANENLESYYTMKQNERQSYKSMISGCNVGTPGVIIDTKVLGKKYMPNLRRAEDWGLWMMYLRETEYIVTYPKALWKYRHISGSETSNKWKQLKSVVAMYKTVLGMNTIKAWLVCSFVFLPKNIWKKLKKKF
ncbi:MAG: glycosyltransferase family 2 protein [Bacteroidales bacterium]|jgi:teichuronic acid biosynthesis glycosyltransferase TuaG|nr:glycosyltransferase family 2 protein [Bacteroidales bacterium]